MWIAKNSGRLLLQEQDGDSTGNGNGQVAYRWPANA